MDAEDSKTFASFADMQMMHPDLCGDQTQVEAELSLTSSAIRALCDWEHVEAEVLKLVCIQASARSLAGAQSKSAPIGSVQTAWANTPFSGSVTFQQPSGDVYFTAFERQLLGCDEGYACFINQTVDGG